MEVQIPANLIPRQRYLDRLKPFIGKNIIKVLTGQRRVGKSYILFLVMKHIMNTDSDVNIIYINLEDLAFDFIKTYIDLNGYIESQLHAQKKNAIFIDEIQNIGSFEKVVRSLLLKPDVDIYITGSNSRMLSGELSTVLTGRYIELKVNSLAYTEFLQFHNLDDSEDSIGKYMKFGGMPYLTHLPLEENIAFEYLNTLHSSIVYRDVVERFAIRNTNFLQRLVQFTADNIGNLFTGKSISDFLKSQGTTMTPNLIITYMDYLCQAFLINKIARYDLVGKRYFEIGEKYYYSDIGLRNAITGWRPQSRGQIIENLVYCQLEYLGYDISIGVNGTAEIDFVATKDNEKIYVQAALYLIDEKTVNREFGNLMKINDNYPKYVVSLEKGNFNSYLGITHISLHDFLKADYL